MQNKSKALISANNAKYWKGKNISQEVINKIKKTKERKPQDMSHKCRKYLVISPNKEEFVVNSGLGKFSKKHNLTRGKLVSVAQGHRNHHKKWKCEYLEDKIYPRDKTYKLTDSNGKEYIINNITTFAKGNNLDSRRLYEVARKKRYCHRGWKCEYI